MTDTYETHAKGIRILPGMWRPHYPYEQIAWISPPWPCQDYLWLDFPEAIFTDKGLMFLSHVNPPLPTVFQDLPAVPWKRIPGGVEFHRVLPNRFAFGGRLQLHGPASVRMELWFRNGTDETVGGIKLQTCAYLRGIDELAFHGMSNKFVHVPGEGWLPFEQAQKRPEVPGGIKLGWHWGPAATDLPVIVTASSTSGRYAAMTWFEHTDSLTGNPSHPCMHADPNVADLAPGASAGLVGEMMFFEGALDDFTDVFRRARDEHRDPPNVPV